MKVFITTSYPDNHLLPYLQDASETDPFKIHQLTDDPEAADIIIFTENHPDFDPLFLDILKNKIYKKYKQKCYLHHDNDRSITFLPTVTPSLEQRHFNPIFNQPFCYIIHLTPNHTIRQYTPDGNRRYLFSFVGAIRTNQVRKRILNIKYDRCHLFDTSDKNAWELSAEEREEYEKQYAEVCFESKFILCPRGFGPNSYRLYECMEMGIAPVIISDGWVPTPGPDWGGFSIRIPEADVDKIAGILEKMEDRSEEMGQLARQAWESWFSKDKQFHNLTEACLTLHSNRDKVNFFTYLKQYSRLFEPFYARCLFRHFKHKIKATYHNRQKAV